MDATIKHSVEEYTYDLMVLDSGFRSLEVKLVLYLIFSILESKIVMITVTTIFI